MTRFTISILVIAIVATSSKQLSAHERKAADVAETKYLTFQLMTTAGATIPMAFAAEGPSTPTKAQMGAFVREIAKAIGTTGDARHKLGFVPTHFPFDMSDEDTRRAIHDAFAVARDNDVAVAFHLDDAMYWGKRKDLLSNPENIETADWKQIPSTGRRVDWGPKPSKFVPQMCYNSPAIQAAVKKRASFIGTEVKKELAALKTAGKEHLFAGVISGSESHMGRDFETNRSLGYRALKNRGFSEKNPPKDPDLERVAVVKEFMELWANSLHAAGVPREKIFCHNGFTDQGLRKADAKESYAEKVHFALPEVVFSSAYRPGFSTYPEGRTFKELYAVLEKHGSPGWISAEGTNVSPTSMPGEPTMETYLGRVFNHGGVLVNLFSWGIGGDAQRKINFFRKATENPEALAAYGKFLRGEKLVESSTGFSSEAFQAKMRRIQTELPAWVQKTGQQAKVMPITQKLQALIKDKKWQEADKMADELLGMMKGDPPMKTKAQDEATRKHLLHELGGPFFVSRDKVQEELKFSDYQKKKLREKLTDDVQEAKKVFSLKAGERDKAMQSLRQTSHKKLAGFLKEILTLEQLKRFQQLKLQYDTPAIMLQPETVKELKITDEQRKQFIGLVQEMQKEIEPLMKQAKSAGKPEEILPKVIKLRLDCQEKVEALLSDAQKKQWQGMIGKPFVIW
jgi:hypothetical protein